MKVLKHYRSNELMASFKLHQKGSAARGLHHKVLHQQACRKFKEFRYKRFRYFVKYSRAQVNISESSKSYAQRK